MARRHANSRSAVVIGVVAAAAALVIVPVVLVKATRTPAIAPPPYSPPPVRIALPATSRSQLPTATGQPRAVRSVLNIETQLKHGRFVWNDGGVPPGPIWLRVDTSAQTMSVFRGGHEIGTAVVLYGANEKPTPAGRFVVLAKRRDHRSNLYDSPMPYTLRLTNDGVSIHGVDVRLDAATHGCIGVPLEFARLLFDQVRIGDEVDVTA